MNFFRHYRFLILSLILIGCFVLVNSVSAAGISEAAASLVASLLVLVVDILGKVLVVLMHILIWVASYNDFVKSAAVTSGWTILRDVCNMLFILILLVIAFATVLNLEGYSWKKLLPKMLLWAVLINFSKLICGVAIDFAQVIMLTFVNGFRDIGGGNLAAMLGIPDLLSISSDAATPVNLLSIAGTYILALLYVIVSIGVIVIILFVLVMRIVMLWILVTLSPLAFLLNSLPNTSKYASKWQSQFVENVISGPILAFFIWLSFASASYDVGSYAQKPNSGNLSENEQKYFGATAGLSKSGSPEGMLKFIISIGMLMGGVIITKELGGTAAKAVSRGMSVNNWARQKTTNAAKNAGKATAQTGLRFSGGATSLVGQGISKLTGGAFGEVTQKRGQFLSSWGKDIQKTQKDAATARKLKTLGKLGLKEQGLKDLQEYEKASFGGKMVAAGLSGSPMELYKAAVVRTWPMKWMGGKLKDFSTKYQKKIEKERTHDNIIETATVVKDLETQATKEKANSYEKLGQERDSKISTLKQERDQKLHNYDTNEQADLDAQKARFLEERAAMKARGASEGEIKQFGVEHKQKLDSISDRYANLRNKANTVYDAGVEEAHNKYGVNGKDAESKINLAYQDKINLARDYHRAAKKTRGMDAEIETADQEKERKLNDNKIERDESLKDIRRAYASSPAMVESETKKVNTAYDKKAEEIEKEHQEKIKEINEHYKDAMPIDTSPSTVTKLSDKAGNALEQYDPLELTNAAIKKGLEAMKQAAEIFSGIGFKRIGELSKSDFARGARGTDEITTRVWKMMEKGDAESLAKLKQVIDELKEIKSRPDAPTGNERKVIQGMKEGLGAYLRDNPGSRSNFTVYIESLDKIDTGPTVDDFIKRKGNTKEKKEKDEAPKENQKKDAGEQKSDH